MSFSFYVEPHTVAGEFDSETRQLYVGLGSDGPVESVCVGIFDECDSASIHLTRDELDELIDQLEECREALGEDAL